MLQSIIRSLGLAIPPRIRFLQRMDKKRQSSNKNFEDKEPVTNHKPDSNYKLKENKLKSTSDESSEEDEESIENHETNNHASNHKANKFTFGDSDDDDDDDDDILILKRKNIDIDDIPEIPTNNEILDSNKKKAVTKAAVAKKILRKKIVPNKKTTFDEDGEEVLDPARVKISEIARQYEKETESGINIEIAKQILREEDKFDKQRFRQKIKEKHKEEKRKLKTSNKKENKDDDSDDVSDEEDLENNDNGNTSESDQSGPDLSWLPDPDKIYGKQDESDEEESENTNSEEDEEESKIHRPPKRKLLTQEEYKKIKKKQKTLVGIENTHLKADEELALQLLQN